MPLSMMIQGNWLKCAGTLTSDQKYLLAKHSIVYTENKDKTAFNLRIDCLFEVFFSVLKSNPPYK